MDKIIEEQRAFFKKGTTLPIEFRKKALQKLFIAVQENEALITEALYKDLHKSMPEAYLTEISFIYHEIKFALKNLNQWMKPQKVSTSMMYQPGRSFILHDPLGLVLVIGPWNYPFQLMIAPLIGAIAAGNCVTLKPSELAPHTSAAVTKLVKETFSSTFVSIFEGGIEVSQALLKKKWDHIFYTGGERVAKYILQEAAVHLTPVTLELGGKSPCILDSEVDLKVACRRIVWGKFFNAGQTCVAPDYIFVPAGMKSDFVSKFDEAIKDFFSTIPKESKEYGRIINERHYERLKGYLKSGVILRGGETDDAERYIAPTLLDEVSWNSPVMEEEIFGPILPVLEYGTLEDVIQKLADKPKPLALYFFSTNKNRTMDLLTRLSFGGGCINDTLVHLANPELPFGGVGTSGMGSYHGKFSFEAFSHKKSIVWRGFKMDFKLRYPPYEKKFSLLKKVLDLLP